jgi:alpha-beta hydrolase superfamily lysophospholipase
MTNRTEHWLDGARGRIFVRQWNAEGETRANLVLCHGFNAHSGHWYRAAETFAAHGFSCTAADLRGRGQSDGERFYVDAVDEYVADLSLAVDLARSERPGRPTFLMGHSAGGVTSVTYALDHQDRIDGLICESFAFRVPAPDFALKLIEGASHIIPHTHALTLKMADFSRDPEWVAKLNADPLVAGESQPTATVAALARADERLSREFGKITVPLLILHGTEDHATRPDGSEQFYREAGSTDKTLKLYEGHYHDLLNDLGREEVLADVLSWLETRVNQPIDAEMPLAT